MQGVLIKYISVSMWLTLIFINNLSYTKELLFGNSLARYAHCYNSGMNLMGVTHHLLSDWI